jgi:methyltransferase, FkbM family
MRITDSRHVDDVQNLLQHLPRLERRGVIHVGAHRGEEVDSYLGAGFDEIVLIEANPSMHGELAVRFAGDARVRPFHCAISDHDGTIDLHIHTSRTGSVEPASILPLKRFKEIVGTLHTPETVRVRCRTLDSLLLENEISADAFGLLNIDVQGAELLVLKGAERTLASIEAVIAEVALLELYEGAPLENEIVEFLGERGFVKVEGIYHTLYEDRSVFPAWGECLFVKERDV